MDAGSVNVRLLLRFLFSAVGLLVASYLVPGIRHGAFIDLVAVAVILGALNGTLGLLLRFIAFVPMVCSFGCLSLFINGTAYQVRPLAADRSAAGVGLVAALPQAVVARASTAAVTTVRVRNITNVLHGRSRAG